jgi:Cys-tRNA(Pro)/Cys-tRNA(Cys) deacylase
LTVEKGPLFDTGLLRRAGVQSHARDELKPADTERLSGYKAAGISPFGQMRQPKTAIEQQAMAHELVFINGGQRGLQVRLNPGDAVTLLDAIVASMVC